MHKTKVGIFEKLQFLDGTSLDGAEDNSVAEATVEEMSQEETIIGTEQHVITDNQEYYEVSMWFYIDHR